MGEWQVQTGSNIYEQFPELFPEYLVELKPVESGLLNNKDRGYLKSGDRDSGYSYIGDSDSGVSVSNSRHSRYLKKKMKKEEEK